MIISLYIKGELVDSIPFNWSGCKTIEDRMSHAKMVSGWLKYKYRVSLQIIPNWEIVIEQLYNPQTTQQ